MNELKIACFGTNAHQIHRHASTLTRARFTAFGGIDPEQYGAVQKSAGGILDDVPLIQHFEQFLEQADADMVALCSPIRSEQAGHAIAAMAAGKHVLAEKPMALTLDELNMIRDTANDTGRRLWTMLDMVYDPAVNGMKDVVQRGELGEIVQIFGHKSYPYHERRPQDPNVDGGLLMQAGIHALSLIYHVTGLEFETVQAMSTGTGNPGDGQLQMGATMTFRMNNGALASILCNFCNPPNMGYWGNDQLRIHGTKGMIELTDGLTRRQMAIGDNQPEEFPDVDPGATYPQDIIDAILDDRPTFLRPEAGFTATEAVIRANAHAMAFSRL